MSDTGHSNAAAPLVLGWEEWLSLPDLSIAAIKAKVDTGARTSALHAFDIALFGPADRPMVRFSVHPVRARNDITLHCKAPVVDRREVASSNGDRELRYVISTTVRIGDRQWPIEITLTDRSAMTSRMLLGRGAIRDGVLVDPRSSYRQPRLSYRLYRGLPRTRNRTRPLTIALVSRGEARRTERLITREALRRGHTMEHIDWRDVALTLSGTTPGLTHRGLALGHVDAVIPLIGAGAGRFGTAIVRQFELMGAFTPNPSDALALCRDRLAMAQRLVGLGLPVASQMSVPADNDTRPPPPMQQSDDASARLLVVAGRVYDISRQASDGLPIRLRGVAAAQIEIARRAARRLGLGFADMAVGMQDGVPYLSAVSCRPRLADVEETTATRISAALIELLESRSPAPPI